MKESHHDHYVWLYDIHIYIADTCAINLSDNEKARIKELLSAISIEDINRSLFNDNCVLKIMDAPYFLDNGIINIDQVVIKRELSNDEKRSLYEYIINVLDIRKEDVREHVITHVSILSENYDRFENYDRLEDEAEHEKKEKKYNPKLYRINYVTVILSGEFLSYVEKEFRRILKENPQGKLHMMREYVKYGILYGTMSKSYKQCIDDLEFTYHAKDFLCQGDMYAILQRIAQYQPVVFNVTREAMETYFENFKVGYDCVLDQEDPLDSLLSPRMVFDRVDGYGLLQYMKENSNINLFY